MSSFKSFSMAFVLESYFHSVIMILVNKVNACHEESVSESVSAGQ
jgi:hypothetical protein